MATSNDIIIKFERRPCYVEGKRAMFHRWYEKHIIIPPSIMVGGDKGGEETRLFAIVEYQDGTIGTVSPYQIQFADDGGFGNMAFLPYKEGGETE